MSDLLQFVIVAGFGALCFGCGYLIAFIVTRNRWRDEMIRRGVARYDWRTGKWDWGEPPKEGSRGIKCPLAALPATLVDLEFRSVLCRGLSKPAVKRLMASLSHSTPPRRGGMPTVRHYALRDSISTCQRSFLGNCGAMPRNCRSIRGTGGPTFVVRATSCLEKLARFLLRLSYPIEAF
jgi:hypothetical protein